MGDVLDRAVDISELGQRNLWVIYGKSTSGKTGLLATFPKPILYLQIGDDGSNTISEVDGIKAIRITEIADLNSALIEARLDTYYKTVAVDTFSLLVNEWTDVNAIQKKKKMSMNMWGDLKTDTEELVKLAHILALKKIVVLTCHEVSDSIEGFEDEITPDVRPSVSKGARTYLEGMANYGIHTTLITKDKQQPDGSIAEVVLHAAHLGPNPYYWNKTQKSTSIKLPKIMINPTYAKIMKKIKGE